MERRTAWTMILLGAMAVAAASAASADTLDAVKKRGELVVGVRGDTPPFGFLDRETGGVVGVEPELAAAVAKRLGVKLVLRRVDAEGRVQALLNGEVDLLAASLSRTEDRAKVMDFGISYFRTTQRVLARKGAVTSVESLKGMKVGTAPGSSAERALREKVPTAACFFYPTPEKALEALRKGEVDALTASGSTLYGCLDSLPKEEYEVAGEVSLSEERYRMAVRKGDTALLDEANAALEALEASGGAKAILDRWFRPESPASIARGLPPAIGAVTRAAATPGRFVVLPFRGIFRAGAEVSFLDPQGALLGKGKVANLYEDEVYVDGTDLPPGLPQPGFPVAMNYSAEEARSFISGRGDLFSDVKAGSRREADLRAKEEGERFERENRERERYQEDMAKTRMHLDYQYSDEYYRYWRPLWP